MPTVESQWLKQILLILTLPLLAGACSSTQLPGGDNGGGGGFISEAGGTTGSAGAGGTGGQGSGGSGGTDAGVHPDGPICCPPDATLSGCMHLGGTSSDGVCWVTCDFWCTSNWRIEQDAQGCPFWRYDVVACVDSGADRND